MIRWGRGSLLLFCLMGVLAGVFILLALLEYRWAGMVSEANHEIRRRWLAINFGVLIVLAVGIATIVVAALRAQKFLRLQMEFVAGVSHELRTPISVIGSAADNLAAGVVRSDSDVREYGSLIRDESRRLSDLVEQTLRFAAGKADHRPRDIQLLRVAEIVERSLSAALKSVESSSFVIERSVDPDLPLIRADSNVLVECLVNLLNNALKYGGENRWLSVRASSVETGRGSGVEITVADRGIGIPPDEVSHVFEPFFRGRNARSAQIHGTGLGLSLAQEAASSMGARITVQSAVGKGTSFTIHIPAAFMNSATVPVEALVES